MKEVLIVVQQQRRVTCDILFYQLTINFGANQRDRQCLSRHRKAVACFDKRKSTMFKLQRLYPKRVGLNTMNGWYERYALRVETS